VIPTLISALLIQATAYQTGPAPASVGQYHTGSGGAAYNIAAGSETAAAPSYSTSPPVSLSRTGVTIDAYDKRIESRWGADDPFYTGTVRGGAALAQSRQGQLDGGWTLVGPDGSPLYVLQLVDAGAGWLEGAWREGGTASGIGPASSGFIALISRQMGRVSLRFLEPRAATPTAITLEMGPDGSWSGEAARGDASVTPVRMLRR
jgi:hypothetical protein